MKDFTASNLKNRVTDILNAVQMDGAARITSRTRPTMVMITEEEFEKLCLVLESKFVNKEYGDLVYKVIGGYENEKGEIINE